MAWVYSLHSLDRSSCFWEGKRAEIYRHRPHCSIWPQRQSLFLDLLHLLALLLKKKGYIVLTEARSVQKSACLLCASALWFQH